MSTIKGILRCSVAAATIAAAPALAQDAQVAPETEAGQPAEMQAAPAAGPGFDEVYGENYGALGDSAVEDLLGTAVVSDAGETVGEVDDFGLTPDGNLVVIVGVGGFLGLGEHDVALPLDSLAYDGEQLLLSGMTREDLEQMPEYDEQATSTFAANETVRSNFDRGYQAESESDMAELTPAEGTAGDETATETAEITPSDSPAADAPMPTAEEQIAEEAASDDATQAQMAESTELTTEGDATQETAEAEGAVQEAGDELAAETAEAGDAVEQAGDEAATEMAEAGDAVEQAGDEAAAEMAEAGDAVEQTGDEATTEMAEAGDAVEQTGDEAATEMAEAGDAVEQTGDEATTEMAEGGDTIDVEGETELTDMAETDAATAEGEPQDELQLSEAAEPQPEASDTDMAEADTNPVEGVESETAEAEIAPAEGATETADAGGWTQEMDTIFGDIADRQISELIGMQVASAEGEVLGEVDNFALQGNEVVAIVGIGGFLGIGEHEVALSLGDLTFDGERLVAANYTEEDLKQLPEYDEAGASFVAEDATLRGSYQQ